MACSFPRIPRIARRARFLFAVGIAFGTLLVCSEISNLHKKQPATGETSRRSYPATISDEKRTSNASDAVNFSHSALPHLTREGKHKTKLMMAVGLDTVKTTPVLIVSYQRCGSSFFGNLFDLAPAAFYVYEPLDSLYNAMYGTLEGWNVPSDIMNYPNGSLRVTPRAESEAVSGFLKNILQCNFDSLPLEFFLHRYWAQFRIYQSSLSAFTSCVIKGKLYSVLGRCQKELRNKCTRRFRVDSLRQRQCHSHLWKSNSLQSISSSKRSVNSSDVFDRYKSCLKKSHRKLGTCIGKLRTLCRNSQMRSVKTVRATMDSVDYLLASFPNLKVIHLIRDPRAVVLSRSHFHSSGQGLYSKGDLFKESKLFCQNLVHDIVKRRQLEEKYPGSISEVLFDRFVEDPLWYAERLYDLLNVRLTDSVSRWIVKHTKNSTDSRAIATKWQDKLTYLMAKQITENCREFFHLIDYSWNL